MSGVIYDFKTTTHKEMVDNSPVRVDGTLIFPVFHAGGLGLSNRPKIQQLNDWNRIKSRI